MALSACVRQASIACRYRGKLALPYAKLWRISELVIKMTYSISTFAIEIDATPTAVLQAKWQSEADEICRGWTQHHWEQLLTKGRHGLEFPPVVKVRLARPDERAAYDQGARVEYYEEVKIVYLIDLDALHPVNGSDDHLGQ
jgi:hypothetical protein